jgi:subtilisin family serine protease/PKD repeat protein
MKGSYYKPFGEVNGMKKSSIMLPIVLVLLLAFSSTAAMAAQPEKVNVLIGFNQTPGQTEEALVRGFGGDVKYTYRMIPAIAASIPETAIPGLLRNPKVTIIEPDIQVHSIGDTYPWGVTQIGAYAVHQSGITGQGVKVAILDSGIDYTHPDLASVYAGGYDFVNGDTDPMDDHGHGTHVAGTIAAAADGAGIIGVAPGVEVYALKVLNKNGSGYFSDIVMALEWATGGSTLPGSIKVDITNNSYGSSTDPGIFVELAFWLAYYQDGVLSVAAAGNSGNAAGTGDNVIYPAAYDSAVTVAATDQSNIRASFSSTGPAVELAAPGKSIYSTYPGGYYAIWQGTSMASPHVVGAAALVMESPETIARDANNDGTYETNGDGVWTAEEVRLLLQATAEDLGTSGKDNQYGYGLVAADEAVLTTTVPNTQPVANAGGPYRGTEDIAQNFDGSGSYDDDGDTITYSWNFGDGLTGVGVTTNHVYTAGGIYTVTLIVNDGKVDSEPSITTADIMAVNNPPVANAGGPYSGTEGVAVIFDGSGSYDSDGAITAYDWNFGDGTTGTGISPTHTYGTAGVYTVTLTVTDDDGATSTDETTVTVNEAVNDPPIADAGGPYSGTEGVAIIFDGSGSYDSDGTITSYDWDFGDGTTGTGISPTHTYVTAGVYSATLTVTDDDGATATDEAIVTVSEAVNNEMHVAEIIMDFKKAGRNTGGIATVTIVDTVGNPIIGAIVSGYWSGASTDTDSGVTDNIGEITFQSDFLKRGKKDTTPLTFTFTVDNVVLSGFSYVPADNVETSDSITVP